MFLVLIRRELLWPHVWSSVTKIVCIYHENFATFEFILEEEDWIWNHSEMDLEKDDDTNEQKFGKFAGVLPSGNTPTK